MSGAHYTPHPDDDPLPEEQDEASLDTALFTDAERREYAGTENATDRRSLRKRAQARKRKQEERDFVVRSLLSQPNGRTFITWLITEVTGVFGASINNDLNPNFLMHREGQRAVGLLIQAECVRVDAANYATALRERFEGDRR